MMSLAFRYAAEYPLASRIVPRALEEVGKVVKSSVNQRTPVSL